MKRQQFYVCEKGKEISETPLTLHIFKENKSAKVIEVCRKCYHENSEFLKEKARGH